MEIGISSFTYSWAVGIPGHLPNKRLSAMDLIETAYRYKVTRVQYGDNLPLHTLSQDERIALKKYAATHNIQVEVGMRGLIPEQVETYLAIATDFQSPFLRMVIDADHYEPETNEIISIIKNSLPDFKKHKIKLAIENHDRFKSKEFVEIVKKTDPEWVGICLDTINSMGADQSIDEVLNDLAPYTLNFHAKDYIIKRKWHNMGFDIIGAPAGQGMMSFQKILKELSKYNRCKSATLELWTAPEEEIEQTIKKESLWAEKSIEYLKKIIK